MAQSTPILLTMGAVGAGNEWLHGHPDAAVKIGVATMALAVVFAGAEAIPGAAPFVVGISVIALVGMFTGSVTPGVPSPITQILTYINTGK